jgi:hypothetical protein
MDSCEGLLLQAFCRFLSGPCNLFHSGIISGYRIHTGFLLSIPYKEKNAVL